jgi:probable rRNA maturation factor
MHKKRHLYKTTVNLYSHSELAQCPSYFLKSWGVSKKEFLSHISRAFTSCSLVCHANHFDIFFCDALTMKHINKSTRRMNKVTDVLSFPTYDLSGKDRKSVEKLNKSEILKIGEILVCVDKIQEQAKSFNIRPRDELYHLVVHGGLHLMGYDHEKSVHEERVMTKIETLLLERITDYRKL